MEFYGTEMVTWSNEYTRGHGDVAVIESVGISWGYYPLIGGLEHEFYDFPFSWDFHHPN